MAKEDFVLNGIKERIIEGLNQSMDYLENWEQISIDNTAALELLQDVAKMNEVVQLLWENAKLECKMVGKIPGNKEVLEIVTPQKARGFAVDYAKANTL